MLIVFPPNLPGPSTAEIALPELRRLSESKDIFDSTELSNEHRLYQNLVWILDSDLVGVFQHWWTDTLNRGGYWFYSSWIVNNIPSTYDRRFVTQPSYKHLGAGAWSVSTVCELRKPSFIGEQAPTNYILTETSHIILDEEGFGLTVE